jgi:hypothetical protein
MSTWSKPYLTVLDTDGAPVDWQLPDPLPWPAGACADEQLRDPVDLGLPLGGTIKVRWRAPGSTNPRSRRTSTADLQTVALACDVLRASRTKGDGWQPDANGWPLHVRPAPASTPKAPHHAPEVAAAPAPRTVGSIASELTAVGAHNSVLQAVASGQRQLGATFAQIIAEIRRDREETRWSAAHRSNMGNVLDFVEQVMVYTEPVEDDSDADLPEVIAWAKARLALPGVEVGGSLHVALVLAPDLQRAIQVRRETDRRVDALNRAAVESWQRDWDRYDDLMTARAAKPRGGKPPKRPADEPLVRIPQLPVSARTEELFATALAMIFGYAERSGLLIGPNPWPTFISSGADKGYRRSEAIQPHRRNVPPVGAVVDLADAIAQLGPIDKRTGMPTGHRFRAMVLLHLLGPRPSEIDALDPDDFDPVKGALHIARSASSAPKAATGTGQSVSIRDGLKGRPPGSTREVWGMPTYIRDALVEHVERGYASDSRLFTGPMGDHLRWSNHIETYWKPAVTRVFGRSKEQILREMPRMWLRKAAVTWLLRSGMPVEQVTRITGHRVMTLYTHYAGVVGDDDIARHAWTGWDDAWAWASQERAVN